jgi:type I restriction enzyme S subunit
MSRNAATEDRDSLPAGWTRKPLGEATSVNPRSFTTALGDDELVSFVPMAAVEVETGRLDASQVRPWKEIKKGYTPFQDGDVLFAKITPCMENGKVALAAGLTGGRAAGSTEFHVVRSTGMTEPKFVMYFLLQESFRRAARVKMKGTAGQLRVPADFMESAEIPLPPLPEQRRIVAEIEKQFTRLEAGLTALRRVAANLKRYRAAVLKTACEGKLVENEVRRAKAEGRSVETGEQLLQRILKQRREQWQGKGKYKEPAVPDTANLPKLPEGWCWATVEQLSLGVQYGYTASAKHRPDGPRFLRITDIQGGRVDWDSVPSCNIVKEDATKYRLESGDLVFARTGATTGKSYLIRESPEAVFASYLIRLRTARSVLPSYVYSFFQSTGYWRQIEAGKRGIGQPNVNAQTLSRINVPLPPLAEQERIVAEVERRLSVVDELQAVVSTNLQRAGRLRQSILQRAFEGRLVAQ